MRNVYCLVNGMGKVTEENDNSIVVEFNSVDNIPYTVTYDKEGHLIFESGVKSVQRTLFDEKPKIVIDDAILDDNGKVIQDKDLIMYGEKGQFSWQIGYFDAKNLSVFTKDGYRNPNRIFKIINKNTVFYKINELDFTKQLKEELIDDVDNTKEYKNDAPEFILNESVIEAPKDIIDEEDTPIVDNYIEKEAEKIEEAESEKLDELVLSIDKGMVNSDYYKAIKINESKIKIPAIEKKVTATFEQSLNGAYAYATISFIPEKVYKIVKNDNEHLLKDYINLFDAYIMVKGNQKNLNNSNISYLIRNGELQIEFK